MDQRRVVLDANVLFALLVRDTLLTVATHPYGLFAPIWSTAILDKLRRNLLAKLRQSQQKVDTLLGAMHRTFPEAVVDPGEDVIATMPNHRKDRHVLAVAVAANARTLVTWNVRDFHEARWLGVRVQDPDTFLAELYDAHPPTVRAAVEAHVAELQAPPLPMDELIARLANGGLSSFAARLRGSAGSA